MIAQIAKFAILIGGLGILAHQLWLHIRVKGSGAVIQQPKTWQQILGLVAISLASIAIVLLIFDFGSLSNQTHWTFELIRILGIALFCGGIFFRVWALKSLGISFSPDLRITESGSLITKGAYAVVRHPFYLSALLFLLGAGFALLNLFITLSTIPLALVFLQRVHLEEKMLVSHFGTEYQQYQQAVPMILPQVKRNSKVAPNEIEE